MRLRRRPRGRRAGGATPALLPLALLLVAGLAGCRGALHGQWRLVEAVPNREVFSVDEARFNRDGSFAALTTLDGKTAREVGTYEFNGFKLTLRPQAGGQRKYDAVLKFNTLEIINGKRKVVLRKQR